ncbi:MAG: hypothetical protein JWP16_561 [Alphaproteobacteria bacterium]|nr:hypothetical protein [Alphaproteobacteria bacterium]
MADSHAVSALKTKRIQVASQIEALQGQLRQATIDLDHVEAALRLFDPEVDLTALSPRKVAPVLYDTKGDTGRIILDTLRASMRPLSTAQVCEAVMKARALDTNDRALCRMMMRRTNANLKHWANKRGLIRSMPGPGQQLLWQVVR